MAGRKKTPSRKGKAGSSEVSEPDGPRYPDKATHILSDLEQVKALADPLRIRLLEAFGQERTTKQAAELLGERPTRLYHHVEALEKVGLIELSRTRPNRGTLEKYYLAVARTFKADKGMFGAAAAAPENNAALQTMLSSLFDKTRDEIEHILSAGDMESAIEEEGLLSLVEIHASEEFVVKLQRRLKRLLADLQKECLKDGREPDGKPGRGAKDDAGKVERRYRFLLAYFPLDRV